MIRHKEVIGLDIGSHSAKAVRAVRRGGGVSFVGSAWVRLPSSVAERDRVLRSFVQKKGWEGLPCVVAVQGESVMLQAIDMAPEDPRSVKEIVSVEVDQFHGLLGAQTIHDHVALRGPRGYRGVFLAVARTDSIERAMTRMWDLGLEVCDVVPSAVALFNVVSEFCMRSSHPYVCVDVGHEGTEVVIGRRRDILFARRFMAGGKSVPDYLRVTDPSTRHGRESALEASPPTEVSRPGDALPAARDAEAQALDAWARGFESCIALYRARFTAEHFAPRHVLLCGGGAYIAGLAERLSQAVGVQVTLLGKALGERGIKNPERYAAAMGLAVTGTSRRASRLSLLPPVFKENAILEWHRKYWILSALVVMLTVSWMIGTSYGELRRGRAALRRRQERIAAVHSLQRDLADYSQKNDGLQRRILPLRTAVHNGAILRAVIQAVAEAKDRDDWITLIADARSYFTVDAMLDEASGPESVGGFEQIVIEGYTVVDDLSTMRRMIESLRGHPAIVDADLLGDDRLRDDEERNKRWAATGCRLFAVEITIPTP